MKKHIVNDCSLRVVRIFLVFAMASLFISFMNSSASAFVVTVQDEVATPVADYRWLLEEDNSRRPAHGEHIPTGADTRLPVTLDFHMSHSPAVAQGTEADIATVTAIVAANPTTSYFLSVLPDSGHSNGGTYIPAGNADAITVRVNAFDLKTAQISILVWRDNAPLNNWPDVGWTGINAKEEYDGSLERDMSGFTIHVADAGGKTAAGGDVIVDAFGNPLGTTYDEFGEVDIMGTGIVVTGPDGTALIKNLAPGKYGITAQPPAGEGWIQTNTIEGGKPIDAWVQYDEPEYLAGEFVPGFHHTFFGFAKEKDLITGSGTSVVSGTVNFIHSSRHFEISAGLPAPFLPDKGPLVKNCIVAINDQTTDENVYVEKLDATSHFEIPLPEGTYQLVIFDAFQQAIIAFRQIIVPAGGAPIDLDDNPFGGILVNRWNGTVEGNIFFDNGAGAGGIARNGIQDGDEPGMTTLYEDDVLLRFRDGSVYAVTSADLFGFYEFPDVFPFFNWLVAEIGFGRFYATGLTAICDAGGVITADPEADGKRNPQLQSSNNGDGAGALSRTEVATFSGEILLEGVQVFADQNLRIDFGKDLYAPGEHGGITGITYYSVTRAEDDPEFAAAEEWEAGIPRVQITVYNDADGDGVIDDADGLGLVGESVDTIECVLGDNAGDPCTTQAYCAPGGGACEVVGSTVTTVTLADVDNYPLGNFPGAEDVDRNYAGQTPGVFDAGDAIQIAHTDSWDDNIPEGCLDVSLFDPVTGLPSGPFAVHGYDIPGSWGPPDEGACFEGLRTWNQIRPAVFDGGYAIVSYCPGGYGTCAEEDEVLLPFGKYIVEGSAPLAYSHVKEEDKNVDFGDVVEPAAFPAACVGKLHQVPEFLTLFPGEMIEAPFAGDFRELCDLKQVDLNATTNGAAAEFFLFTDAPKSGRIVGLAGDDLNLVFDANSPSFGEKYAPPNMNMTFLDHKGFEIMRVLTDEWGKYDVQLPGTYSVAVPMPTGVSPYMVGICINNPFMPDPLDPLVSIPDPTYKSTFSTTCYTLDIWSGRTTYGDTPVVPVAAFTGDVEQTPDCEYAYGTPLISAVDGSSGGGGAYLDTGAAGTDITITSQGSAVEVPNPAYPGTVDPPVVSATIMRDYSFGGATGKVTLDDGTTTTELDVVGAWDADTLTVELPAGGVAVGEYQLMVEKDGGATTPYGITFTIGDGSETVVRVPGDWPTIQKAIDKAPNEALVLVDPGEYNESVIMHKNVKLQGSGAGSCRIVTLSNPGKIVLDWTDKLASLIGGNKVTLLPGQDLEWFLGQEAGGISVIARKNKYGPSKARARIDGFRINGKFNGGGIFINGHARYLDISNNRISSNQGKYGGGIRVGTPDLIDGDEYVDANNDSLRIMNNQIVMNGGIVGAGGVSIFTGATAYEVRDNYICGNLSHDNGGGIGQNGFCGGNSIIDSNKIVFNEVYDGTLISKGGGIYIGGLPALAVDELSPGTGRLIINSNLIKGNLSGSGDGGGIFTNFVNGQDVVDGNPGKPKNKVDILNNVIVNNVAALAGAGIAMQDTEKSEIWNNTIANNDSTASSLAAFSGGLVSTPQIAGIATRAHSAGLEAALSSGNTFSKPKIRNNIIRHNRSFYWDTGVLLPDPDGPPALFIYNDLGVVGVGGAGSLGPRSCLLTDTSGTHASNEVGDPLYVLEYFNSLKTAAAGDEGGNFVQVRFGPLTPSCDYHITATSAAEDVGQNFPGKFNSYLEVDIDGEERPNPSGPGLIKVDMGADELY